MKNNNLFAVISITLGVLLIISIIININYFYNKPKCKENLKLSDFVKEEISKNDFEINLFADKKIYKTTDKINIWATLKYVGNNDTVKIWHGSSYMIFSITDGKDFNVEGVINTMLTSTILEKNKLYRFDYQKSGGFDADGPKADFWEKFYQEKYLLLPAGEYTITVKGDFDIYDDLQNSDDLLCSLTIKVEK